MSAVTLGDALDFYLRKQVGWGASSSHVATVKSRLGVFVRGYDPPRPGFPDRSGEPIREVTKEELAKHFAQLKERLSDGALAGHSSTHRAFWKYAKRKKWVRKNIAKKLPKFSFDPVVRQAAPGVYAERLAAALFPFMEHHGRSPSAVRDALFVSFCLGCGARRGQVLGVRWRDVDRALERPRRTTSGEIVYRLPSYRGKAGTQAIRFFSETAEIYLIWREMASQHRPGDSVFLSLHSGHRLHPDSTRRAFRRICEFAGLPVTLSQALRKRVITDVIDVSDVAVGQDLAGHADAKTTKAHYREGRETAVDNAAGAVVSRRRKDAGTDAITQFFEKANDG